MKGIFRIKKQKMPVFLSEEKMKKLNTLLDSFDVIELDNQSLALSCKKNLVLYVDGNMVEITKNENVKIGKNIHLNPVVRDTKMIYDNISELNAEMLLK